MKQNQRTPGEIAESLNRAERLRQTGRPITLVCRELGISRPTYYRWKREYGGMTPGRAEAWAIPAADGGGTYEGAEPLSTMLVGVHRGLQRFEDTEVPGDRFAVLGVDHSARITERTLGSTTVGTTLFNEIKDITDIPGQTTAKLKKRMEGHFFFPRVGSSLNLPEAFIVAKELLVSMPGSEVSENFVVLISDGVTKCVQDGNCGDDYTFHQDSLTEVTNIIQNEYVPDQIRLHYLMIGENVQPHTKLMIYQKDSSSPKSCMTDTEARLSDPQLDFVDESSYSSGTAQDAFKAMASGTGTYFGSHALYSSVRATDGLFLPVRPCCQSSGSCADVSATLESACENSSTLSHGDVKVVTPHTDSTYGRLTCDPLGRSERQQIQDFVDSIFEREPYALVE